jgi:toxin ParE1/3/4
VRPWVLRPRAREDRRHEVRYYRDRAGADTAARFIDALEQAFAQLARQPGIGSPTLGQEIGVEGLRTWRVRGFALSVWYFDRAGRVEVVRLVGQRQEALWIDVEEA